MPVEIPREQWPGQVHVASIGATAEEGGTRCRVVTVGGEKSLPFLHFEGAMRNRPAVAMEIRDRRPNDWSQLLADVWGDVIDDPATWAPAAEAAWRNSRRETRRHRLSEIRTHLSSFLSPMYTNTPPEWRDGI